MPRLKHCRWALTALIAGLLTPNLFSARAAEEVDPRWKTVELDLKKADTDEQLIQLARAAKINVMADATDWPDNDSAEAKSSVLTVGREQFVYDWLRDLSYLNRLTWRNNTNPLTGTLQGSQTFMVWREPDVVALARRIEEEAKLRRPLLEAAAMPLVRQAIDAGLVQKLDADPRYWSKFMDHANPFGIVVQDSLLDLAKKQGWDGKNMAFTSRIATEDIPTPLLSQFILQSRLRQTQPSELDKLMWLHDEPWKGAKLTAQPTAKSSMNGVAQPRPWILTVKTPFHSSSASSAQTVAPLVDNQGGGQ